MIQTADWRSRNHPAYWAFLAHRISGLLLALFLPAHFWALSRAIEGEARLDALLRWTENPLGRLAQARLVVLLAAHLARGVGALAADLLVRRDGLQTDNPPCRRGRLGLRLVP